MKKSTLLLLNILLLSSMSMAQNFGWARSMGSTNRDAGASIAVDAAANVYTTGSFSETADFDPGAGTATLSWQGKKDIFIQKLDAAGDFLWAKSIGGSEHDAGEDIAVDAMGNVYVIGYFQGTVDFDPGAGTDDLTAIGGRDIFVLKLDSNGDLLWARSMGGASDDYGSGIATDASGNIYTTGRFAETAGFGPGSSPIMAANDDDIFIEKLNPLGNSVWVKSMGGTDGEGGFSIAVDGSGNVHTSGYFNGTVDFDPGAGTVSKTTGPGAATFVHKLDTAGDFVWVKIIGENSNSEVTPEDLAIDALGNVYTTGTFYFTKDFDPGAGTNDLTAILQNDIFIQKLDSAGNFVWARAMGGTFFDAAASIAVDPSGNVYTTGFFGKTVDFDPGAGVSNHTAADGITNIYIQKLDAAGDFVWAKSMGAGGSDFGTAIAVDAAENVYTTGYFVATVNFNPNVGNNPLTAIGGLGDVFIQKLSSGNNVGIAKNIVSKITLYPNPNSGQFYIELPQGTTNAQLTITDALGKIVYQDKLNQNQNKIEMPQLSTGIYQLNMILDSGERFYGKVVLK